jgi:hypothetical protein
LNSDRTWIAVMLKFSRPAVDFLAAARQLTTPTAEDVRRHLEQARTAWLASSPLAARVRELWAALEDLKGRIAGSDAVAKSYVDDARQAVLKLDEDAAGKFEKAAEAERTLCHKLKQRQALLQPEWSRAHGAATKALAEHLRQAWQPLLQQALARRDAALQALAAALEPVLPEAWAAIQALAGLPRVPGDLLQLPDTAGAPPA